MISFFNSFFVDFLSILGLFWEPFGTQNLLWEHSRSDLLEYVKTIKNMVGSLQNEGSQDQTSMQKWASGASWHLKKASAALMGLKNSFFVVFCRFLGPFGERKSMKNRFKNDVEKRSPKKREKEAYRGRWVRRSNKVWASRGGLPLTSGADPSCSPDWQCQWPRPLKGVFADMRFVS